MVEALLTVPHADKEPTAIHPVKFEKLAERVNTLTQSVAKRAYEIFESNGRMSGHDLDDWFKAEKELLHPVYLQIADSGEQLELKAEMPGFTEKEIEITVEPKRVTITAKRENSWKEKNGKTMYCESNSDEVLRVVNLPALVEAQKVRVSLKNGILDLLMPKAVQAKMLEFKPTAA